MPVAANHKALLYSCSSSLQQGRLSAWLPPVSASKPIVIKDTCKKKLHTYIHYYSQYIGTLCLYVHVLFSGQLYIIIILGCQNFITVYVFAHA